MSTKLFAPSSALLLTMIKAAEAKFEADREQSALRAEARADERTARMWIAEAESKRRRALYGVA